MKKLLASIIIATLCVFAISAQESEEIDLTQPATMIRFPDDWPTGSWYDSEWNATWVIGQNDIKIYEGDELVISFADKVSNYKVTMGLKGLTISFDCEETNRSYSLTKPISLTTDLELVVDRKGEGLEGKWKHWETSIKFQKQ